MLHDVEGADQIEENSSHHPKLTDPQNPHRDSALPPHKMMPNQPR